MHHGVLCHLSHRIPARARRGVLLERAAELSMLAGCLEAVGRGSRGQVLLVGGEAGVGKTTLVRRFCEERGQSARILWGTCDPLFTPSPLGPLLGVAEGTGGELQAISERGAMPHEVVTALLVYERHGNRWQLGALEWVFPSTPATAPLPGATYGSFGAACHYKDGTFTFTPSQDQCAKRSPQTGARFNFWHPDLVTLHVWIWYPNPAGLYNSTNPWISPFNDA